MKNIFYLILVIFLTINLNAQEIVVSPTVNNILYKGIDNYVIIMAEGYDCDDISAAVSCGKIKKFIDCEYIINPEKNGELRVSISENKKNKNKELGSRSFRVKNIPTPTALINGKTGGNIIKNQLVYAVGIKAELLNFEYEVIFKVTSFKIAILQSDKIIFQKAFIGNMLTPEIKREIFKAKKGYEVRFEEIIAVTPDSTEYKLEPISFKIR